MHSIKPTTISLRISSILYLMLGLIFGLIFLFFDHYFIDDFMFSFYNYFLLIFTLGIIVFIEIVIASLKKRKKMELVRCTYYLCNIHSKRLYNTWYYWDKAFAKGRSEK